MAASDPKGYFGPEATVEVGDAIGSISSSSPLAGQMTNETDFSADISEITITDPEASVEVTNTFGGQIKTESPFEIVTADFTMVFRDIAIAEELHGTGDTFTASSTNWTRISGGATIGSRPQKAILFRLKKTVDSTDYIVNYLMDNAIFQQMGELSLSGDGTAELTGTAVCLIADRHWERNY